MKTEIGTSMATAKPAVRAVRRRAFVRRGASTWPLPRAFHRFDSAASPARHPFRLKRILLPTDFLKTSRQALRYALALAKQTGAAITLLHVVHAATTAFGRVKDLAFEDELRRGGARQLSVFVQKLLGDEASADIVVRIGNPAVEIIRAAQELKEDLIIISTHGYTGLKHVLLGSTAERVVRDAPCPVLVVREREHEFA